jgi:hypothetical protein
MKISLHKVEEFDWQLDRDLNDGNPISVLKYSLLPWNVPHVVFHPNSKKERVDYCVKSAGNPSTVYTFETEKAAREYCESEIRKYCKEQKMEFTEN